MVVMLDSASVRREIFNEPYKQMGSPTTCRSRSLRCNTRVARKGRPTRAAPRVTSPRLYVIDCGTLVNNKPEDYNLRRDEVKDSNMGVTCYLVIHPKGILIYDTGLNDRLGRQTPVRERARGLRPDQVQHVKRAAGRPRLTPAKVDYLVLSHYHWDHIANAGEFAARPGWSTRPIATRCSVRRRMHMPGSASIRRSRRARRSSSAATTTYSATVRLS